MATQASPRHGETGPGHATGRVEVDECYVGGPEDGLVGRLNLDKALVVVAAQEDGSGIGRRRVGA